ncbi:hypothetical protein AB48_4894 [Escherichia coli 3-475-03_S1_C2]|nr:hypothetical protein AB48_4894 [Escherichia coli 3-475-03_S1_C2]
MVDGWNPYFTHAKVSFFSSIGYCYHFTIAKITFVKSSYFIN